MTSQSTFDILILASVAAGILTILSLVGEALRGRLPWGQTNPAVEIFMTRVQSWWVMVILMTLAALSGKVGIVLLFAFASFAALREFLTLATKRRADHLSLALGAFVILPLQYVFVGLGWTTLQTVFIPVFAFLLLPVISALRGDPRRFLERVAETQWGLMLCVYCVSHVPALVNHELAGGTDAAILLIGFLVMVVQFGDLFDYYAGRRFGRRKIARDLSPRTVEGTITGLVAAAAIGAGLSWITPFSPLGAAAMAALASATGVFGSLVIAAIRRDKGVKDWSHLIPGQGGVLGQLDSVIFAAPIFYHALSLFVPQA
ncbi:phosphatidate cytidylyltransferase [Roseicyclus marinus]|uniref:phosphatidate cytidylyltransferase n=1 Tax=Roseicyclus marinus TaxID=2161673 RepID=UPI00240EF3B0|nr:phosphatidate cytidylyltransferase [Roseicyclus marinus]MDG3042950.1 phosphatidate cytidylyltransferase [Roseicyclus marinus]